MMMIYHSKKGGNFMSEKEKQEQIVFEIVKANPEGIRTEQVKIAAMYKGVSCADRYLRWLAEKGLISGEKFPGNKTKTWKPVKNTVELVLSKECYDEIVYQYLERKSAKDYLFLYRKRGLL
jgi:predicted transcriptional regulator